MSDHLLLDTTCHSPELLDNLPNTQPLIKYAQLLQPPPRELTLCALPGQRYGNKEFPPDL